MPDYRRIRVPGGTAFFTANLLQRRGNALLIERIDLLRDAIRRVRRKRPFIIDAWVVLPNHLHAIWTLPPGDDDTSTLAAKTFFARGLPGGERRSPVRRRAGERGIWQRRFWEHVVLDDADYATHMDYVHFNPVKHGYVTARPTGPTRPSAPVLLAVSIRRRGAVGTVTGSRRANPAPEACGGTRQLA